MKTHGYMEGCRKCFYELDILCRLKSEVIRLQLSTIALTPLQEVHFKCFRYAGGSFCCSNSVRNRNLGDQPGDAGLNGSIINWRQRD